MNSIQVKRRTVILTAIALSVVILAAVAFAGATPNAGYQAFKELMKNHEAATLKPEQGIVSIEIKDNGNSILAVSGNVKADEASKAVRANVNLTAQGLEKELQFYGEEGAFTVVDVAKKQVYVGKHDKSNREGMESEYGHGDFNARNEMHESSDWDAAGEAFMDQMMGDMANKFKLSEGKDGSQDIVFEITQEEMPAWLSLMIAAKHDESTEGFRDGHHDDFDKLQMEKFPLFMELKGLETQMPELVDQKQVELLKVKFDRATNGELVGIDFEISVNGLDATGAKHNLEIIASVAIDASVDLVVTPLDLTGLEVFELPAENE